VGLGLVSVWGSEAGEVESGLGLDDGEWEEDATGESSTEIIGGESLDDDCFEDRGIEGLGIDDAVDGSTWSFGFADWD
jgi:hypothetical protein